MGLLAVLNLPERKTARRAIPQIDVNVPTADPKAVARAERKASRRDGKQRAVLEAAIDMAEAREAIGNEEADLLAVDPGNPTPVSRVAPRSMYEPVDARKQPKNERYGSVDTRIDVTPQPLVEGEPEKHVGMEFQAQAIISNRTIVKENLGHGETISAAKGVLHRQRASPIMAMPEDQVLRHEHLHVVAAARLAHAIKEFADVAFLESKLPQDEMDRLETLLERIAKNARHHIGERLHELIVPDTKRDLPKTDAALRKLLVDGTVERIVRTALLDEVRLHSRALAKFRR